MKHKLGFYQPETESECKTALEAMLLFETGSIDSVDITIKLIFTSGSNSIARINQEQTKFDITQMQKKVVDWVSQFGPKIIDYNNK